MLETQNFKTQIFLLTKHLDYTMSTSGTDTSHDTAICVQAQSENIFASFFSVCNVTFAL